jgi:thiamine biosynthesis lipoprotein
VKGEKLLDTVETELIMGLPITVVIVDRAAGRRSAWVPARDAPTGDALERMHSGIRRVFDYLREVDEQFSPYKETSEVSRINRCEVDPSEYTEEMNRVVRLAEETKELTHGFFDVWFEGKFDPSGIVKGLALHDAGGILRDLGYDNFCIDGGGDIEVKGRNSDGRKWRIGIRNPFSPDAIIKALVLENRGIATSGLYIRGEHIYDPVAGGKAKAIASMTVVGPNVYEADRIATAAFAMGNAGLELVASLHDFDGYMVEYNEVATYTDGFLRYVTL